MMCPNILEGVVFCNENLQMNKNICVKQYVSAQCIAPIQYIYVSWIVRKSV